jgi:hypothetical protein
LILRLVSGDFGDITVDPTLSDFSFGACEVRNRLRFIVFDKAGDFAFIVRTEVTEIVSSGVEDDVEHIVRLFVRAVFICEYVNVRGTNDVLGIVSEENEEVAYVFNVFYVKRYCVRRKMIIYIVMVIIVFVV